MNHSPKRSIAAVLLASLALAAVGQTPQPAPARTAPGHEWMGPPVDSAEMRERMAARRAQRMAHFKETLQITAAQEGAWNAWSASMQPPGGWKRPDRAQLERLATPERIDRMRAMRAERNAIADRRAEATKAFYAALDPIQKRVFDVETAHIGQGRGEGGRGHHGHHGQRPA